MSGDKGWRGGSGGISVNGFHLIGCKSHAVTGQFPEGGDLPATHPMASVPCAQNKVAIGTVSNEIVLCLPLSTQNNAVMVHSHLARSNTTMHVVFTQVLMHQPEGLLQPA